MSRKEIIKIGIYLLSLLIVQEVVFRIVFPLPEDSSFNRIHYTRLGISKEKYGAIRKIKLQIQSSLDSVEAFQALNNYGFRGHDWQLKKEKSRFHQLE